MPGQVAVCEDALSFIEQYVAAWKNWLPVASFVRVVGLSGLYTIILILATLIQMGSVIAAARLGMKRVWDTEVNRDALEQRKKAYRNRHLHLL